MGWVFRKVGRDQVALKAAVQLETNAPQLVRDEVCKRIDEIDLAQSPGFVIAIESHGHMEALGGGRPLRGLDEITIHVWPVPFIGAP